MTPKPAQSRNPDPPTLAAPSPNKTFKSTARPCGAGDSELMAQAMN
jgi:hypothetical protein